MDQVGQTRGTWTVVEIYGAIADVVQQISQNLGTISHADSAKNYHRSFYRPKGIARVHFSSELSPVVTTEHIWRLLNIGAAMTPEEHVTLTPYQLENAQVPNADTLTDKTKTWSQYTYTLRIHGDWDRKTTYTDGTVDNAHTSSGYLGRQARHSPPPPDIKHLEAVWRGDRWETTKLEDY